jgi:hypothetical protein
MNDRGVCVGHYDDPLHAFRYDTRTAYGRIRIGKQVYDRGSVCGENESDGGHNAGALVGVLDKADGRWCGALAVSGSDKMTDLNT